MLKHFYSKCFYLFNIQVHFSLHYFCIVVFLLLTKCKLKIQQFYYALLFKNHLNCIYPEAALNMRDMHTPYVLTLKTWKIFI